MKKLVLLSITVFTTLSLLTACGENDGTANASEVATPDATTEVTTDSTTNATDVVADTTKN
jgi:ABC-type oligopeptide transport system substrate-binding subunit